MLDDEPSDAAQRILSLLESSLHARQLEDAASPSLPPRGPASCGGSLCSGSRWGGSSAIESVVDDSPDLLHPLRPPGPGEVGAF